MPLKLHKQPHILLTIITIICTNALPLTLTTAQTITPTSPPPKTPTTVSSPEPNNTQIPLQLTMPKTQNDLTILTGNIQRPNGLTWLDNKIYTVCSGDWTLYEINTETGATTQYIYGIRNANDLYAINENNETHLWIPDFQSNTLVHINRGVTQIITSNLQGPWGITPLDDNTFAITNLNSNTVTTVAKDGTTTNIITNLRSPSGIEADELHLYIANTGSARRAIEWFDRTKILNQDEPINSTASDQQSLITGLQNTTNLVLAQDGYLYFSYALGTRGVVGRIDPDICIATGGCTSEQVEIVLYTELAAPLAGLTITPDMRLYVHTMFSPDIYWVDLTPNETTTTNSS